MWSARRVFLMAWVLGAVAACVRSDAAECADGSVCAPGTVCALIGQGEAPVTVCVFPDQLAACEGRLDGEPCEFGGNVATCRDGVCFIGTCGNRVVEGVEACDDGNTTSGDGCSNDCRSAEVCGNGIVDPVKLVVGVAQPNERCDEGAGLSHDGCDSTCGLETARWEQISLAQPGQLQRHAIAFDRRRNRVVVMGGADATLLERDESWVWNGRAWAALTASSGAGARVSPVMTYDVARDRLVLFGGADGSFNVSYDDTWEFDGRRWTLPALQSGVRPPARYEAAMVYDPRRKVTVLFGGASTTGSGVLGDTWEWDGSGWRAIAIPGPSPRRSHAMTYDPVRGVVVLHGGSISSGPAEQADTWVYDGVTWTPVTGATPSARMGAGLAWDPSSQRAILFGGQRQGVALGDTWAWDGAGWTQLLAAGPSARLYAAMASDADRGGIVLYGGGPGPLTARADTWWWDGDSWQDVTPPPVPSVTYQATATDLDRQRVVSFGGKTPTQSAISTTMEWVDGRWLVRAPSGPVPAPRHAARLVYDEARQRTLLFGGLNPSPVDDGTWSWDGTAWTRVAPPGAFPARTGASVAYHAATGEVIMFGGRVGVALDSDEMWAWNGTAWTLLQPPTKPPPRAYAAMAYDPLRQRTVLFGGTSGNVTTGDLWEWDGATWREVSSGFAPASRTLASLTWNPSRRRLVLAGGAVSTMYQDVWEWDGTVWTPLDDAVAPFRINGAFASDRGGVLQFGGADVSFAEMYDAWRLQWDTVRFEEACDGFGDLDDDGLRGCADPDCWWACTPTCLPGTTCDPTAHRCGDGACDPLLETCRLCPADCGACATRCGDGICDGGETPASCPGDC